MYMLTQVYYWASIGCPDAMPAGALAFKLGMNEANFDDSEECDAILECAADLGLLDDAAEQLGFEDEDKDLLFRDPEGGDDPNYLTANCLVSDWMWSQLKMHPGLNWVEHDLDALLEAFEVATDCEDED